MARALTILDMMKGWVEDLTVKNRDLEEENKSLKLTNLELTKEVELEGISNAKNVVSVGCQVEEVNLKTLTLEENKSLKLKVLELTQELEMLRRSNKNTDVVTPEGQVNEVIFTPENTNQSREVLSDVNNAEEIPRMVTNSSSESVENDHVDEFIPLTPQTETRPSVDDEIDIDIKEEDADYKLTKSKSNGHGYSYSSGLQTGNPVQIDRSIVDQPSDISMKREIDRSIQKMFLLPEQGSNNDRTPEDVSKRVRTDHDPMTHDEELELALPQPQISIPKFCGQKEPYLTTRTVEKTHTCESCSEAFETQFKLREHRKSHTGEKGIGTNLETRLKRCVAKKSTSRRFSTRRKLTGGEKVNSPSEPKKQRKVPIDPEAEMTMGGVGERMDPLCVAEVNPLSIKKMKVLGIPNTNRRRNKDRTDNTLERRVTRSQLQVVVEMSKCGECTKIFSTQNELYQHKRIHTGEKRRRSTKRCKKQEFLTTHMKKPKHNGQKHYECVMCEESFIDYTSLTVHQIDSHSRFRIKDSRLNLL